NSKSSGPLVNCTGLGVPPNQEEFSASAQTLFRLSRKLWNRKYRPSGAQFPQHSWGTLFQAGSKGRKPLPSRAISQTELELLPRSAKSKRSLRPSGEK